MTNELRSDLQDALSWLEILLQFKEPTHSERVVAKNFLLKMRERYGESKVETTPGD